MVEEKFITKIKYCPVCGTKYDVKNIDYSGTLKCESCKFRNYIKSFPTVCGIIPNIDSKDEILMVQRAFDPGKGQFDPPGGFVNYDESPEDAILREIKEELGVDAKIQSILNTGKTSYIQNGINYPTVIICFLLSPLDLKDIKLDITENSTAQFIKISDVTSGKLPILWKPVMEAILKYSDLIDQS